MGRIIMEKIAIAHWGRTENTKARTECMRLGSLFPR